MACDFVFVCDMFFCHTVKIQYLSFNGSPSMRSLMMILNACHRSSVTLRRRIIKKIELVFESIALEFTGTYCDLFAVLDS